jgi:hypothetical protein
MSKAMTLAVGIFATMAALTASNPSGAEPLVAPATSPDATGRFVSGVITGISGPSVTITPVNGHGTSGNVTPGRTRIVVNGRAGNVNDLAYGYQARGEIGLDDVWVSIHVVPKR